MSASQLVHGFWMAQDGRKAKFDRACAHMDALHHEPGLPDGRLSYRLPLSTASPPQGVDNSAKRVKMAPAWCRYPSHSFISCSNCGGGRKTGPYLASLVVEVDSTSSHGREKMQRSWYTSNNPSKSTDVSWFSHCCRGRIMHTRMELYAGRALREMQALAVESISSHAPACMMLGCSAFWLANVPAWFFHSSFTV